MKNVILSIAAAATLFVASLATPATAEAGPWGWRGGYYGGPAYYGGYYRPYYGGYYRPYSYGNYYQPYGTYYRGYGYGYPAYNGPGYRYPRNYYYGPGVRIGAGPVGVRVY